MPTQQLNSLIVSGAEIVLCQQDAKHDWSYEHGIMLSIATKVNNYEDHFPVENRQKLFLGLAAAKNLIGLLQARLDEIEAARLSVGSGI